MLRSSNCPISIYRPGPYILLLYVYSIYYYQAQVLVSKLYGVILCIEDLIKPYYA